MLVLHTLYGRGEAAESGWLVPKLRAVARATHLWFSSARIARQAIQRYEASQKIAEFAPLVALIARRRPARVLEIGTKYGGTLLYAKRERSPTCHSAL
jgi:cephalosporin hydroxylase